MIDVHGQGSRGAIHRTPAAMSHPTLRSLLASIVIFMLGACQTYDLRVNDRVVYTPKPLFTEFEVANAALRECLEQAISDNKITAANEMVALNCSHAGIDSLEGLDSFHAITQLKLSHNTISDLSVLTRLSVLEFLYLDNNAITDATPIIQLPTLQVLDISGNSSLRCPGQGSLLGIDELILPLHCRVN